LNDSTCVQSFGEAKIMHPIPILDTQNEPVSLPNLPPQIFAHYPQTSVTMDSVTS